MLEEDERHVMHAQRHHNEVSYVNSYLGNETSGWNFDQMVHKSIFCIIFFPNNDCYTMDWAIPLQYSMWTKGGSLISKCSYELNEAIGGLI
jgi:hypothetical protein